MQQHGTPHTAHRTTRTKRTQSTHRTPHTKRTAHEAHKSTTHTHTVRTARSTHIHVRFEGRERHPQGVVGLDEDRVREDGASFLSLDHELLCTVGEEDARDVHPAAFDQEAHHLVRERAGGAGGARVRGCVACEGAREMCVRRREGDGSKKRVIGWSGSGVLVLHSACTSNATHGAYRWFRAPANTQWTQPTELATSPHTRAHTHAPK